MAPLTVAQMRKQKEKKATKGEDSAPTAPPPTRMVGPTIVCDDEGSSTQTGFVRLKQPRSQQEEIPERGVDGFRAPPPTPLVQEEIWSSCFQPTTEEGPLQTIWDRRFGFPELIDTFLVSKFDDERVKAAGLRGSCQAMEAYGCWLTCIARSMENQYRHLEDAQRKDEEQLKHLRQQLELAEGRSKSLKDALQATKEKVEEAGKMQQELDALRLGEAAWKEKEKVLGKEIDRLKAELDNLRVTAEKEKDEVLEDATEEKERGFDRALAQVWVLYPDLYIFETGFFKDIVNGRLVDA